MLLLSHAGMIINSGKEEELQFKEQWFISVQGKQLLMEVDGIVPTTWFGNLSAKLWASLLFCC
jgi:hypothetical protein